MKTQQQAWLHILSMLTLLCSISCIGDDFIDDTVEPEIRIINNIDTIAIGSNLQLEAKYLNNIGQEENINTAWSSSNTKVITIDNQGLLSAVNFGESIISVESTDLDLNVSAIQNIVVAKNTSQVDNIIEGQIKTTSSYKLTGSFTIQESNEMLNIKIGEDYCASTALPGLFIYLSNNKNSIANALEIARVEVFNGFHEYNIPNVGMNDYSYILYFCKPFNVKVGDAEL